VGPSIKGENNVARKKKGEARKETDRLCSEDETGGGDHKAERGKT
jgi:hypothetical protein